MSDGRDVQCLMVEMCGRDVQCLMVEMCSV